MTTRSKFILLFMASFSFFTLSFMLFLKSDFAQSERAYFRTYPYKERASRHRKSPEITVMSERETRSSPPMERIRIIEKRPPRKPSKIPLAGLLREEKHHVYSIPQKQQSPIPEEPVLEEIPVANSPKADLIIKSSPEKNWRHDASLGYAAYQNKQYDTAIKYFEQALILAPDQQQVTLQLAFAHKKLGHNKEAASYFRQAINQHESMAPFPLKREVEQLENRFDINSYAIYRGESLQANSVTGVDLTQSQMGMELSYQPENIGYQNGRIVQIYGRLLSAVRQGTATPDPDSYQAGVGVRWKPLSRHNLVLSAERLQKIGDFARNDWMIRIGYSRDYGTDYKADRTVWWSHSLYLDAALIDPDSPDIYLTGQVITGYNMKLRQGLILQPRLTALASWQQDRFQQAGLVEAGPGLNLRFYFNDTKYEAYRSYIDLTVEYRLKLSGNSIGGSGPVIGVILHF